MMPAEASETKKNGTRAMSSSGRVKAGRDMCNSMGLIPQFCRDVSEIIPAGDHSPRVDVEWIAYFRASARLDATVEIRFLRTIVRNVSLRTKWTHQNLLK